MNYLQINCDAWKDLFRHSRPPVGALLTPRSATVSAFYPVRLMLACIFAVFARWYGHDFPHLRLLAYNRIRVWSCRVALGKG